MHNIFIFRYNLINKIFIKFTLGYPYFKVQINLSFGFSKLMTQYYNLEIE